MSKAVIFWNGFISKDRYAAISEIRNVVANYGDIVGSTAFSDLSISLIVEIEESKIDILYEQLMQVVNLGTFDKLNSVSRKERTVYLNISFAKGTGDLKNEVPSVPG